MARLCMRQQMLFHDNIQAILPSPSSSLLRHLQSAIGILEETEVMLSKHLERILAKRNSSCVCKRNI